MKTIILYGTGNCPNYRRIKFYLDSHNVHYQSINLDVDKTAMLKLQEINENKKNTTTLIIDETPFRNPNNKILRQELQLDHAYNPLGKFSCGIERSNTECGDESDY